ncbi:MAG TPA: hypothetical protein VKR61_16855 [Bryobacteraceae bacterium]|nr:hypothetical protein [Bryobacteraceae bacterium]
MHFRRLACFFLGAWLAGGLFMDMVATQNFRSVDRLLAKPASPAAQQIDKLGPDAARRFLRHQISEQNRWYFETWGVVEIGLGVALLLVLLFGSTETNLTLLLALLMLLIAVVQRFALTPQMVVLGRIIDWVPPGEPSPERSRFWMLHNAFAGLDLLNLMLGFLLTAKLLFRRRRRGAGQDEATFDRHPATAG